jgi:hypothetical protein
VPPPGTEPDGSRLFVKWIFAVRPSGSGALNASRIAFARALGDGVGSDPVRAAWAIVAVSARAIAAARTTVRRRVDAVRSRLMRRALRRRRRAMQPMFYAASLRDL